MVVRIRSERTIKEAEFALLAEAVQTCWHGLAGLDFVSLGDRQAEAVTECLRRLIPARNALWSIGERT